MTNQTQCFKPAFRVEDSNGDPVSGAVIYFFDAGTTTPRTVYSDYNLSVSLGTSVTCNSVGIPTSDGSTVCEVYTGTSRWKLQIKDSSGTLVPGFSWDNIIGALDTSGFATTTAAVAPSFLAKSADYVVLSANNGALIEADTTSGSIALTLPSAVTVGATFVIGARKKVAANSVTIASVSAQTIRYDATTAATTYTMSLQGEFIWLESDGANWVVRDSKTRTIVVSSQTLDSPSQAGKIEYDGTALYASVAASKRGSIPVTSWAALAAAYTLTSTTSTQKLFNVPAGGVLSVVASTRYRFECLISLSSMSATSGNALFDLLGAGSATLTGVAWCCYGLDATTPGTAAAVGGGFTATNAASGNIVVAATGTAMFALITGTFRVNAGGTIVPSIGLTTAAAAVVGADSYFVCSPMGPAATTTIGDWA